MRGIVVLCFLLVLPIFAALGHDIYVTYQEQDFTQRMKFSNVRYLWSNYEHDTYEWAEKNIEPETWSNLVAPVLDQKSVIIAGVPALVIFSLLLILRLFQLPPFAPEVKVKKGHKKGDFGFGSGDRGKGKTKMSYKRK